MRNRNASAQLGVEGQSSVNVKRADVAKKITKRQLGYAMFISEEPGKFLDSALVAVFKASGKLNPQ